MSEDATNPEFSAIVVVGSRQDDIGALVREYWQAIDSTGRTAELIVVIDGPRQDALEALEGVRADGIPMTIIQLSRMFGDSTALMSGFDAARGETISGHRWPKIVSCLLRVSGR